MRAPRRIGVPLSECRDCADPIRFVKLETGGVIPINPAPGDAGNVAAIKVGGSLHGFVISKDHQPHDRMLRFTPHAATCTAVDRTPKKPKPPKDPALF